MHTDQLKYLSVINTYGSLRSAAEKLFITPSALSSSVKKLEEELGFQLLERSNQGVTLTQFGQKLLILANKFELDIANIPQELNTYSHFLSQATSFKWISHSFQVFANPVLSQLLIKISHDYPQIKMFPVRMNHSQLTAGSWHEQTPLAFTSLISTTNGYIDHLSSDLTFHMLYSSDLYLVVSKSSKYATLSHIHLKDLSDPIYIYVGIEPEQSYINTAALKTLAISNLIFEEYYGQYKNQILDNATIGLTIKTPFLFNSLTEPAIPFLSNSSPETVKFIPVIDDLKIAFGYLTFSDTPLDEVYTSLLAYFEKVLLDSRSNNTTAFAF